MSVDILVVNNSHHGSYVNFFAVAAESEFYHKELLNRGPTPRDCHEQSRWT